MHFCHQVGIVLSSPENMILHNICNVVLRPDRHVKCSVENKSKQTNKLIYDFLTLTIPFARHLLSFSFPHTHIFSTSSTQTEHDVMQLVFFLCNMVNEFLVFAPPATTTNESSDIIFKVEKK